MKITLRNGRLFGRIYNFYFDYTHPFEYFWILLNTLPTSNSWRGLWPTSLKQWCSLLVSPSSRSSMWWVCGDDHEDEDDDNGGRDTKTVLIGFLSRNVLCIRSLFSLSITIPLEHGEDEGWQETLQSRPIKSLIGGTDVICHSAPPEMLLPLPHQKKQDFSF